MNLYEQVYNIVWILLGLWICIQSIPLKVWVSSGPGTGFFPFVTGVLFVGCGFLLFLIERSKGSAKDTESKFWADPDSRKLVIYVFTSFCAMAFLMPFLGFFLTSLIIITFLLRLLSRQGLIKVLFISILYCSSIYVFFNYILQIRLPKGFLNF